MKNMNEYKVMIADMTDGKISSIKGEEKISCKTRKEGGQCFCMTIKLLFSLRVLPVGFKELQEAGKVAL